MLGNTLQMRRQKREACEWLTAIITYERVYLLWFRHYNSFGRTYLFDLDFYHIKKHEDDPPKYTVDAYHAGNVSPVYFSQSLFANLLFSLLATWFVCIAGGWVFMLTIHCSEPQLWSQLCYCARIHQWIQCWQASPHHVYHPGCWAWWGAVLWLQWCRWWESGMCLSFCNMCYVA